MSRAAARESALTSAFKRNSAAMERSVAPAKSIKETSNFEDPNNIENQTKAMMKLSGGTMDYFTAKSSVLEMQSTKAPSASVTNNPEIQSKVNSSLKGWSDFFLGKEGKPSKPGAGGLIDDVQKQLKSEKIVPEDFSGSSPEAIMDDIANLGDKNKTMKTPEGKKIQENIEDATAKAAKRGKKAAKEAEENKAKLTDTCKTMGKILAFGGALAAVIALILKWMKDNTGCYMTKKGGDKVMSCKQSNCQVGVTCGDSSGKCNGQCCSGGESCSSGSTCSCEEKTFFDGLDNLMDKVLNGMKALGNLLNLGFGALEWLLENWQVVAAVIGGLVGIFVISKLVSTAKTIGSAASAVT